MIVIMMATMMVIIRSPEMLNWRILQVGTFSSVKLFMEKAMGCGIWEDATH